MKTLCLDAMEHLDPALIEEAEAVQPKRRTLWLQWGAMAACLCLCLVGARSLLSMEQAPPEAPKEAMASAAPTEAAAASENGVIKELPVPESDTKKEYTGRITPMIGSYSIGASARIDLAVANGAVLLSDSLQAALAEYEDSVLYRVVVEVFRDGTVLSNFSDEIAAETQRLSDAGYIVATESVVFGDEVYRYLTLHAEADQLRDFPAHPDHGYYIALYDDYLGLRHDVAIPELNAASGYPAELLELETRLCDAAAAGEYPFIHGVHIREDPLRLEVMCGTNDETKLAALQNAFDPDGRYLTIVLCK